MVEPGEQGEQGEKTDRDEPKCKCGYGKHHPMVSAEPKYDAKGWFFLIMGATPDPVKLVFKCRRCDQVIDETDDPAELKRH